MACTALLLAASLGSTYVRNDVFEFCTTKAHGFPCPWFFDWCECEHRSWPISPLWVTANILLCTICGFLLASFIHLTLRLFRKQR